MRQIPSLSQLLLSPSRQRFNSNDAVSQCCCHLPQLQPAKNRKEHRERLQAVLQSGSRRAWEQLGEDRSVLRGQRALCSVTVCSQHSKVCSRTSVPPQHQFLPKLHLGPLQNGSKPFLYSARSRASNPVRASHPLKRRSGKERGLNPPLCPLHPVRI